ncbi:hypothetical protein RND71_026542 [Anisodus tanguticus]|uniref:Uncharacterized protein n=1 Tax=Anisodus tanguticus TaxID=243964 RepID=A0AAE1RP38_9SOLA|nr:hypothetical protein RND71_026542 [Anisodus tanguticus]
MASTGNGDLKEGIFLSLGKKEYMSLRKLQIPEQLQTASRSTTGWRTFLAYVRSVCSRSGFQGRAMARFTCIGISGLE